MEFKILETTKGKKCLCYDGFFFRFDQTLKNADLSWKCTDKKCNARIKTDDGLTTILSQKNKHNHSLDERKVERHQLRVSAKRKATKLQMTCHRSLLRFTLFYANTKKRKCPMLKAQISTFLKCKCSLVWSASVHLKKCKCPIKKRKCPSPIFMWTLMQ